MRHLLLMLAALSLSACGSVYSPHPLGEDVVALDQDIWQGSWLSDEVVILTTVLDSEKGLLQAAWLERGLEGAKYESYTGTVRKSGDWFFLNMLHDVQEDEEADDDDKNEDLPGGAESEYFWARIENNGKRTILWWPDVERFRRAVAQNSLPGRIKPDNDVVLGALSQAHLDVINSPSSNLLNWAEPVVFIRIGED